jgi:hypothetical protein
LSAMCLLGGQASRLVQSPGGSISIIQRSLFQRSSVVS